MKRRTPILALLATGVVVLAAAPAGAHIEAEPPEAPAGSTVTITLGVEHGCEGGGDTTRLTVGLPDGVTGPAPEPLAGWQTAVGPDEITWSGGRIPHDQPGEFAFRVTVPDAEAGTVLWFPTAQHCDGDVVRWVDTAPTAAAAEDLELPAPAVTLTASTPTSTGSPTTAVAPTTTAAATTTTTPVGPTVAPVPEPGSGAGGGPAAWVWALVGAGGAAGVVVGLALARQRRGR